MRWDNVEKISEEYLQEYLRGQHWVRWDNVEKKIPRNISKDIYGDNIALSALG